MSYKKKPIKVKAPVPASVDPHKLANSVVLPPTESIRILRTSPSDIPLAISYIADKGYDPEFGARPVKRAIQEYVLNELSKKLLTEEVLREKPVIVDAIDGNLVFHN